VRLFTCKLCGLASPQPEWKLELNDRGGVVEAVCPRCPKPEHRSAGLYSLQYILGWMEGV